MKINIVKKYNGTDALVVLVQKKKTANDLKATSLSDEEKAYVAKKAKSKDKVLDLSVMDTKKYVVLYEPGNGKELRSSANSVCKRVEKAKQKSITVFCDDKAAALHFVEGLLLSAYKFDKYKSEKPSKIETANLFIKDLKKSDIEPVLNLCDSVCDARNWVNEPIMELNAERFANILHDEAVADVGAIRRRLGQLSSRRPTMTSSMIP